MTLNFNDDGLVPVYIWVLLELRFDIPSRYVFGYEYLSTYLVWRLNRRGRAGGPKLKAFRLVDHSSHRFIMTAWCRTMSEVS